VVCSTRDIMMSRRKNENRNLKNHTFMVYFVDQARHHVIDHHVTECSCTGISAAYNIQCSHRRQLEWTRWYERHHDEQEKNENRNLKNRTIMVYFVDQERHHVIEHHVTECPCTGTNTS
jgi:hypothetical protein